MDKDTPAVRLVFDPRVRVEGETVEGEVHLYFPTLREDNIEEVHIKLRGSLQTKVTQSSGNSTSTHRGKIDLCHSNISLWQQGSLLCPQPGTHTLQLPFRFTLPQKLPPTCSYFGHRWEGSVSYSVEAVGVRSRLLPNRRVLHAFSVLPSDIMGAGLHAVIRAEGWTGGWTTIQKSRKIRRGLWGTYSDVSATLSLPDVEGFPVKTAIPFMLTVITISKPMKKDSHSDDDSIFPTLPRLDKDLEFRLEQEVWVRAECRENTSTQFVTYLGGMPEAYSAVPRRETTVEVIPSDKIWIPSDDAPKADMGQWKQEVTFKSSFRLSHVPTFNAQIMSVQYYAFLKIAFPGIENDLRFNRFPIRIVSCMPPPDTQEWDGPPSLPDELPTYSSA